MTLSLSDDDFGKMVAGKTQAQRLFMSGKLKVKGDVMKVRLSQHPGRRARAWMETLERGNWAAEACAYERAVATRGDACLHPMPCLPCLFADLACFDRGHVG